MKLRDTPIKRKLTMVIMLVTIVALGLMGGAFSAYEFVSFHKNIQQSAQTLAQITAAQTSASLEFDDDKTAGDILFKLRHRVLAHEHVRVSVVAEQVAGINPIFQNVDG